MLFQAPEQRPIYRHIVVHRRNLIEKVADPEDFRRLRQQVEANLPVDDDIKHLVVHDTLRKTMQKVMAWAGHDIETEGVDDGIFAGNAFDEADLIKEDKEREKKIRYQRQEGYVVSRIVQDQMPGGGPLPSTPTLLYHPGFAHAEDNLGEFMRCAQQLADRFRMFSDRQVLLIDAGVRSGVTLVTVIETPIIAIPRADFGVELICEFHQKINLGHVDTTGFDVYSEIGEYPIKPPNGMELMTMIKSADELFSPGQG